MPERKCTITLPHPPSANAYWRHPNKGKFAGRSMLSAEARAYRNEAVLACRMQRVPELGSGPMRVVVKWSPPDRRKRDAENTLKASMDALTHARVWEDDSQIIDLRILRREVTPGGKLEVEVTACDTPTG